MSGYQSAVIKKPGDENLIRLLLAIAVILAANTAVFSQYNVTSWTVDNGLPQNGVYSILQTTDGYLWFTTLDGLVRFDGVTFTSFGKSNTNGLNSNRFNTLLQDSEAALWIGTADGGLTRYRDGRFVTFTTSDGLPQNAIRSLLKDNQGVIAATRGGLVRWQNGRFSSFSWTAGTPADNPAEGAYYCDHSGSLWYANGSLLYRYKDGQSVSYPLNDELRGHLISTIYEDRRATIWIGTLDAGLVQLSDGHFSRFTPQDGLPDSFVTTIYEDSRGTLWVGTRRGLATLKEKRFVSYDASTALAGSYIRTIYEDREGNLWVGTDNQGLFRLTRQAVTFYTKRDGLLADIVYPIVQDSAGAIWIGGKDGSLTRYKDSVFTRSIAANGGPYDSTTALTADREGRLWIGKIAAIAFMKEGKLSPFDPGVRLGSVIVRAILEDRDGTIWFGTSSGLLSYRDGKVDVYTTENGLASDDVEVLLEGRDGKLWAGTSGGLSCYFQQHFNSFTEADGLPSNRLRSLYEDAEGTLWIGTYDGGLGRLKNGRFTRYTVKEGLFNNGVFCILEDAKGNLWMSSNRGIYRIRRQELNDYAEGRRHDISSISYGRQDGLTNIECNGGRQPAGFKMSDGKLWFPTQGGVAVIDPESISENRHVPEVVIEHCLIQRDEADCRQEIEIKPGKDNLEIVYTGLSFIKSDQIHFKYKLEGWDRDWVDAGTRRAAYYANLPPGHYDFKVIAANSDGVWNNTGTSLSVVVVPPFWRTWWFLSLAGLTIAATAFLAYRRRVDSLRRAHAAQEAFSRQLIESQEHEKKRIAAELHDSLGQNLLIIKNRALLGTESATNHQEFKERFDSISASASQAIDEVRQIAYNLRPYLLDRLGLTNALEDMLERVAASTDIHFTVEIDSIDGLFSKDQEINVFRLIQECVNNVVKHSRATEASVRIKRTSQTIDIRIEDNGQGFLPDRDKSNRHGFGLTGTAERVKMLGGQYRIDSTVGASTAVIIQIDLNSKIPDVK